MSDVRSTKPSAMDWPPTEEELRSMTVAEFKQGWEANSTRALARGILHGPSVTFARLWPLWTLNFALVVVLSLLITWKGWSVPRLGMASLAYLGSAIGTYLLWSPWLAARRHPDLCAQQLEAVERQLEDESSESREFLSALIAIRSPLSGESEANRRHAARLYRQAVGLQEMSLPVVAVTSEERTESLPRPSAPASDPA
jgi:hypothetical protein